MPRIEQTILLKYTNPSLVKHWLKSNLKDILNKTDAKILNVESMGKRELASTVLSEPADNQYLKETEFIQPDFGIYKRHQHGTHINLDLIVGLHHLNEVQSYFHTHPQILRTSYKNSEMFSYDINKANFCGGINYTDWKALAAKDFEDVQGKDQMSSPWKQGGVFEPKANLMKKARNRHIGREYDHFQKQSGNKIGMNDFSYMK